VAWLSKHAARLANDLSLITTKFDLQIVSSYSPSLSTVPRLIRTSPPRPRKYKCSRTLLPSTRGRTSFWAVDVRLVCPHYREPVPPAILDGTDVAQHVCASIRWVILLTTSSTIPSHRLSTVNLALYQLLENGTRRATRAVALLTFAAVVIRAELAALLGSFAIQLLLDGRISLTRLIKVGLFSSLVSIGVSLFFPHASARVHTFAALTVLIDSYFWDQWPLWPEFFSIYFNVYEGKSAEWGVSIFFIRSLRPLILLRYLRFGLTSRPSRAFLWRPSCSSRLVLYKTPASGHSSNPLFSSSSS
jgi:hypothetical protein